MPFTVSHVVAVIPIYKYLGKYFAFSALVIGSMVPDFGYMTPYLVFQRMDSHSLVGIYLYGIPMGLTVYYLYHFFMAPVIVSLLPRYIRQHLHPDLFLGKIPDIPSYILIFSIVVGALTHIYWDFFTHYYGLPRYIEWFNKPFVTIDDFDLMPYRILQHFSTLFGLSLLTFLIWKWIIRRKNKNNTIHSDLPPDTWQAPKLLKKFARYVIFLVPISTGILYATYNIPIVDNVMFGLFKAQLFLRYAVVSGAAAFIICCVLLGAIYHVFIYRHSLQSKIN